MKTNLLLTPGPVPLHPKVQEILSAPMIHHRTEAFRDDFMSSLEGLKKIFQTQQPCFILTSTGTGGMEALLMNTVKSGDKVLSIIGGKFGERWYNMVQRIPGVTPLALVVPPGKSLDLNILEEELRHNPPDVLLCQATETSTGEQFPIKEIALLFRKHCADGLFLVDAITGVGAYSIPMDEWQLDGMVGGSQKAFMLPTGLSFVALSERAWKKREEFEPLSLYWDLKPEKIANNQHQTFVSSNITLIRALRVSLEIMLQNGLLAWWQEIAGRAQKFRDLVVDTLGISLFSQNPSPSLTVLHLPEKSSKVRNTWEKKYGVTAMDGQDQLKNQVLRVGHMGHLSHHDLKYACETLYRTLIDCGVALPISLHEFQSQLERVFSPS